MTLEFNLRHLEKHDLVLRGEVPAAELDLERVDELVHVAAPLRHDLVVQALSGSILVRGRLELPLICECVRCLRRFANAVLLEQWACHLPLTGDDRVPVREDRVDLTPFVREDILLAFPQYPLCDPGCRGLPPESTASPLPAGGGSATQTAESVWAALDKLKL